MKRIEKIKLQIQRLQSQSDFQKWEYSEISTYYIGLIGMLLAIYIPIITVLKNPYWILSIAIILLALLVISNKALKKYFKKNTSKIEELSKEIEKLYRQII